MKKQNKRIMSVLLALVLVLGCGLLTTLAVENGGINGNPADTTETTQTTETTETTEATEATETTQPAETTPAAETCKVCGQTHSDEWTGKLVRFTGAYPYLWSDPANANSQTIVTAAKFPGKMRIVCCHAFSDTLTLYKLESADGAAWPEDFAAYVWVESKYLEIVEETPENSCACCDKCTGKEECQCGCEECSFCRGEDIPELKDDATGVKVYAETYPEGVSLSVVPVDASSQLAQFKVPAAKKAFGLDISLRVSDSNYQPDSPVLVKIPVSAPAGTKIGILHTHNGKTTFLGVTEVKNTGDVEFVTDGFSEFVGFTVDFHYNNIDYSIDGQTSILLSSLFTALEIDRQASDAVSVVFSDPSLVQVTQQTGDWLLTSLTAFDTNETLVITFANGDVVVVDVTDDQSDGKTDDGDYRFTVFSKKITYLFWRSGGSSGTGYLHVMNEKGAQSSQSTESLSHLASGGGNNFFYSGNTDAWYQITTKNTGTLTQEGGGVRVQGKIGSGREIHFYEYNRNLFLGGVASKDYSGTFGAYLASVRQNCGASVNTSTVDRTVVLKVQQPNGTYSTIITESGVKFPNNSSLNHNLTITLRNDQKAKYDLILNGSNVGDSGYVSHSNGTYTIQLDLQAYTATAVAGNGVSATSGTGNYQNSLTTGTVPTFSATLAAGYEWTGDAGWYSGDTRVSTSQTYTFTMPVNNVSYTAKAVPITYQITYNLDGGTVAAGNPATYNVETATFKLNNPTKSGYTFAGWVGSNGTSAQTDVSIAKGSTGDKSYTAKWTAVSYKITYDEAGGGAVSDQTYTAEGALTLSAAPSAPQGYKFNGWKLSAATGSWGAGTYSASQNMGTNNYGNITLVAQWKERDDIVYTVKHHQQNVADDGYTEVVADRQTLTGTTGAEVTPPVKNYPGFTSPSAQKTTILADGSRVVNYYYTRISYSVELTMGTGIGSVTGAGSYRYGASVTISATPVTGYEWKNWTGYSTQTAQTYTFTMPASNVSFTANAKYAAFAVTYVYSGSVPTGAPAAPAASTAYYQDTVTVAGSPTFGGCTFSGWSTTDATISDGKFTMPAKAVTLTGSWQLNTYTVTFSYGNGQPDTTTTYDLATPISLPTPERSGYDFGGWTVTETGGNWASGGAYTGSTVTGKYGDITFSAVWNIVDYSITYDLGGGTLTTPNQDTYNVKSETITLNNPSRTGYLFDGWTGSNGTEAQTNLTITQGSTENRNYTANWTPIRYTVKFHGNGATAGSMEDQTFVYDKEQALNANAYELTYQVSFDANGGTTPVDSAVANAAFNGWTTLARSLVGYEDGEVVSNLASDNEAVVDLYASWVPGTVTLPTPTKQFYRVTGWYTAAEGGEKVGDAGGTYTPDENVTLYAQWERASGTITFDTGGGSVIPPLTLEVGNTIPPIADPVKKNARFIGWSPALPTTMPYEDITVTALWDQADTLTIRADGKSNETFLFRVKGTTENVDMIVSVRGGSSVTIAGIFSDTYTVTELDKWSWTRLFVAPKTVTVSTTDGVTENTVAFTMHPSIFWWLHNENHN